MPLLFCPLVLGLCRILQLVSGLYLYICFLVLFFFLSDGFFSFVGSLPSVAPPAPSVEKEVVEAPVPPPMEPQVEEPAESPFVAPLLLVGSSLLDTLEAAARADEVEGEMVVDNPPSTSADAAGANQPSTSTSGVLLLTRTGERLAQLSHVERLAELLSSYEDYGAKLKVVGFFLFCQFLIILL